MEGGRKKDLSKVAMKGDKLDKHEKALQETQLVKVTNKETLEGLVDIPKVKEIRRALRRRYGNRLNYHKIFNSWDRDRKGYLNLADIHYMINQMGISINVQETRVLIASHDHEGNGRLTVEEFMDLIFSTNDNMNVDLSKLSFNADPNEIVPDEDIMKGIQSDAARLKQIKDKKIFKYVLQKSLKELYKEFKEKDKEKTGKIDYEQFEKAILAKVQLPRYIKENNSLFVNLFSDQEMDDEGLIDYQKFCEGIRSFRYVGETDINIDLGQGKDEPITGEGKKEEVKVQSQMHIFDVQKVPSHQLERIFANTLKVSRILQAKYKTAETLSKDLRQKLPFDCNGNVKSKDFENYLLNACKEELKKRELSRKDLEGFLSAFVYSVHRTTDINAVAPLVFSDDTQISAKIHSLHRPLPPPMSVSQTQHVESANEMAKSIPNSRLREMIMDLQDKSFEGKRYLYEVFKDYDRDCDGYISHDDIKNQFKNLSVRATEEEIDKFIELVDPLKRGYLDFPKFSLTITPNMVEHLAPLDKTQENFLFKRNRPNLVPNRQKVEENIEYHKTFANRFIEIRDTFLPETNELLSNSCAMRNRLEASHTFRCLPAAAEYLRELPGGSGLRDVCDGEGRVASESRNDFAGLRDCMAAYGTRKKKRRCEKPCIWLRLRACRKIISTLRICLMSKTCREPLTCKSRYKTRQLAEKPMKE
eukprot:TRINITY_DN5378_c0_g1_i15.p1 TRINITY_DN5378_c0_g1~~TRINITY_DN5378_c0_g1_i15.p1  ORF type:complete len:702 (+),score=188.58 TRINITY_DN5378_c0_g1_i15:221-2326(+)